MKSLAAVGGEGFGNVARASRLAKLGAKSVREQLCQAASGFVGPTFRGPHELIGKADGGTHMSQENVMT